MVSSWFVGFHSPKLLCSSTARLPDQIYHKRFQIEIASLLMLKGTQLTTNTWITEQSVGMSGNDWGRFDSRASLVCSMAVHVLPVGVSYHIRPSVLCIYIVEGCVLQLLQICLSPESLWVISRRRPSVHFVQTSTLSSTSKARIIRKKGGRGGRIWHLEHVPALLFSQKITDNLLIQLSAQQSGWQNPTREEGAEIHG